MYDDIKHQGVTHELFSYFINHGVSKDARCLVIKVSSRNHYVALLLCGYHPAGMLELGSD